MFGNATCFVLTQRAEMHKSENKHLSESLNLKKGRRGVETFVQCCIYLYQEIVIY